MGKRSIIIGIVGLLTGGILHFLSYPSDKEINANRMARAALMDMHREFGDREKYKEMKEWDPSKRKPKYTTGSYIAYGVGGLLLIIGIVVGPDKKVADAGTEKVV